MGIDHAIETPQMIKSHCAAALALSLALCTGSAVALELHPKRTSPLDLEVRGRIHGVAAGESRFVGWADLKALPTLRIRVDGEFTPGPQELTVVFLSDLWKVLPVAPEADVLLATCGDGYCGVYTADFISQYRPFLVLEINGKGPGDWPPPGLKFNPGPYVITVSNNLAPGVSRFPDVEHKKPWGVTTLEVASYTDRFGGFYSGRWAALGASAKAGREIWIHSCASCHSGPGNTFGGTKAGKPFQVLAAYAAYDRAFFSKYVRDPKSLVPCAKMEPHPRYTDAQMQELIDFVSLGSG